MKSGILRARVATLRLNRAAPWPSDTRRRQNYKMRALRPVAGATPVKNNPWPGQK